ncbi:MAG: hypothetical protein ACFB15_14935 [Cyclobacteriaceae bacterium]
MEINLISTGISANGRKSWQKTEAYQSKIAEIKQEVRAEYKAKLKPERNWFHRLLLMIQRSREINRRIAILDSKRNLHLGDN